MHVDQCSFSVSTDSPGVMARVFKCHADQQHNNCNNILRVHTFSVKMQSILKNQWHSHQPEHWTNLVDVFNIKLVLHQHDTSSCEHMSSALHWIMILYIFTAKKLLHVPCPILCMRCVVLCSRVKGFAESSNVLNFDLHCADLCWPLFELRDVGKIYFCSWFSRTVNEQKFGTIKKNHVSHIEGENTASSINNAATKVQFSVGKLSPCVLRRFNLFAEQTYMVLQKLYILIPF